MRLLGAAALCLSPCLALAQAHGPQASTAILSVLEVESHDGRNHILTVRGGEVQLMVRDEWPALEVVVYVPYRDILAVDYPAKLKDGSWLLRIISRRHRKFEVAAVGDLTLLQWGELRRTGRSTIEKLNVVFGNEEYARKVFDFLAEHMGAQD